MLPLNISDSKAQIVSILIEHNISIKEENAIEVFNIIHKFAKESFSKKLRTFKIEDLSDATKSTKIAELYFDHFHVYNSYNAFTFANSFMSFQDIVSSTFIKKNSTKILKLCSKFIKEEELSSADIKLIPAAFLFNVYKEIKVPTLTENVNVRLYPLDLGITYIHSFKDTFSQHNVPRANAKNRKLTFIFNTIKRRLPREISKEKRINAYLKIRTGLISISERASYYLNAGQLISSLEQLDSLIRNIESSWCRTSTEDLADIIRQVNEGGE